MSIEMIDFGDGAIDRTVKLFEMCSTMRQDDISGWIETRIQIGNDMRRYVSWNGAIVQKIGLDYERHHPD
jgi:hypothetical protein